MAKLQCRSGLIIGLLWLITGCAGNGFALSQWFDDQSSEQVDSNDSASSQSSVAQQPDNGLRYRAESRDMQSITNPLKSDEIHLYRTPNSLYSPSFSHKSLSDYAEQLTMQLLHSSGNGLQLNGAVGIASFVHFDQSLQRTSALGNQLAELLIAEVQAFGVAVVDFKSTGAVTVSSSGDLVFSRHAQYLMTGSDMAYLLSGTLIQSEKGVKVNARIFSTQTKVVVASASVMIPHFVVESLQTKTVVIAE